MANCQVPPTDSKTVDEGRMDLDTNEDSSTPDDQISDDINCNPRKRPRTESPNTTDKSVEDMQKSQSDNNHSRGMPGHPIKEAGFVEESRQIELEH